MDKIIIPVGPGRGEERHFNDALYSLISEMRGHVNDLRDSGEEGAADVLERYMTATWIIFEQTHISTIFGAGLPLELRKLANKHRLAIPPGRSD